MSSSSSINLSNLDNRINDLEQNVQDSLDALNDKADRIDLEGQVDKEEGVRKSQDGSGLEVVAPGAVTDPDSQMAIDDIRLEGVNVQIGDFVNVIQKGLSTNDFTDADKEKLNSINIRAITEPEINDILIAAGFSI